MTLREFYDQVFKVQDFLFGHTENESGQYEFKSKDDPTNEVGYEYIYFYDWEVVQQKDGQFRLNCLHDSFQPVIGTADDVISFFIGSDVAAEVNCLYEENSTGNEFYKKGFLSGISDHNIMSKPVPPKKVTAEQQINENDNPFLIGN